MPGFDAKLFRGAPPSSISPPAPRLGRSAGAAPPRLGCTRGRRSCSRRVRPVRHRRLGVDSHGHRTDAAIRPRCADLCTRCPPSCASTSDPGGVHLARARVAPEAAAEELRARRCRPVRVDALGGGQPSDRRLQPADLPPAPAFGPVRASPSSSTSPPDRRAFVGGSSIAGRSLQRPRMPVDAIFPAPPRPPPALPRDNRVRANSLAPSAVAHLGTPPGCSTLNVAPFPGSRAGVAVALGVAPSADLSLPRAPAPTTRGPSSSRSASTSRSASAASSSLYGCPYNALSHGAGRWRRGCPPARPSPSDARDALTTPPELPVAATATARSANAATATTASLGPREGERDAGWESAEPRSESASRRPRATPDAAPYREPATRHLDRAARGAAGVVARRGALWRDVRGNAFFQHPPLQDFYELSALKTNLD